MKYFIDTEFKEYSKQHKVLGINVGYKTPTIDLISIGIISEDGRSYYAINKECDIKEVWNDEWLRENVLLPIYNESIEVDMKNVLKFNLTTMTDIFTGQGKTKETIAKEIKDIVYSTSHNSLIGNYPSEPTNVEFYGYYADYNWVVFCQLFGRMIDLPKGFPMYCRDIKQLLDDKLNAIPNEKFYQFSDIKAGEVTLETKVKAIKQHPKYPTQTNEHNALDDAKWNLKLYKFIQEL